MFKLFEKPAPVEDEAGKEKCSRECQFAGICQKHPGATSKHDARKEIAVEVVNKEDTGDYKHGDPERYDEFSRSSVLESDPDKLEQEIHSLQEKEGYEQCFEIKKEENDKKNWN